MVVDRNEAVSIEDKEEEDGDPSLLERVKSYYRSVFSPARY
jgi:hypothetical protein